jgi:hypothetical protein
MRFEGRSRERLTAAKNFLIAFVLSLVFMYLIPASPPFALPASSRGSR